MARSTPTPRHSARMPTPLPLRGDWRVPVTERAAVCIALVQPQLFRGQVASPRTHEPSHRTPLGMPPQSVVRCAAAACGSSRRAVDAGTRVPPERNPLRNQHRRRPDRARVGHHPTQAGMLLTASVRAPSSQDNHGSGHSYKRHPFTPSRYNHRRARAHHRRAPARRRSYSLDLARRPRGARGFHHRLQRRSA